jgi:multiple sugar transport system ATP-binding protein
MHLKVTNLAKVWLKNLKKRFGDVVAVNNVSLEVRDKEFMVLLGPSGCGKTTILRCIAGLEFPDEGEIYIGDTLVNDLPPKDRDVAMVFQSYALYPHMKVFDNLAFPLKMRNVPKDQIVERVKHTAELLRITHLLDRKPKQLSGGEAQRVALGRAIVRNPRVFLMDEPLSNLDAKLRIYMRAELKRLQKDLGITTIYVTHDQVEAMTMADKVAIMNHGSLQQIGDAHEIFAHPVNLFVAGFIGSPPMNFMDCTLSEKDGLWFLEVGAFNLPIPEDLGMIIKEKMTSSELILGIRPEDISIGKKRTPEMLVEANVYVTEPMGSEIIVDLKVKDDLIKARTTPDFAISIGEKVWIGFNREKIHLFDKKTEAAII